MELEELLTKKNLQEIFSDIFDTAPKWYNLGLALGLVSDELNKIKIAHRDNPDECLREMLTLWLSKRRSPKPTREALISALRERTVGEDAFADELEQNYDSPRPASRDSDQPDIIGSNLSAASVVEERSCEILADEKKSQQQLELLNTSPMTRDTLVYKSPSSKSVEANQTTYYANEKV